MIAAAESAAARAWPLLFNIVETGVHIEQAVDKVGTTWRVAARPCLEACRQLGFPARIHEDVHMSHAGPDRIVLASGSETRRRMLENVGVKFIADSINVPERRIMAQHKPGGASSRMIAMIIASEKARVGSWRHPGALVIGADQVLEFEGAAWSKCRSERELADFLGKLRGCSHFLHSAASAWVSGKPVWRAVRTAEVVMNEYSEEAISSHIRKFGKKALASVGGYFAESDPAGLVSAVRGDMNVVLGMPLDDIREFLADREC